MVFRRFKTYLSISALALLSSCNNPPQDMTLPSAGYTQIVPYDVHFDEPRNPDDTLPTGYFTTTERVSHAFFTKEEGFRIVNSPTCRIGASISNTGIATLDEMSTGCFDKYNKQLISYTEFINKK